MQAPDRSECEGKSVRRPLYGSVWLALFALLGEEWAKLGNGPIELQKTPLHQPENSSPRSWVTRDGSLSRRP